MATVVKLVRQFLSWCRKNRSPGTVKQYRIYLSSFLEKFQGRKATDIKKTELISWGKTWHQLQAVQRLYKWAVDEAEILEKSPFKKITLPKAGGRQRILNSKELTKLIRRSSPDLRKVLIALRETLARPQEIRLLKWSNLFWENRPNNLLESLVSGKALFLLHNYKSRERRKEPNTPRVIPISPRLGRLLARLAKGRRYLGGRIFKTASGRAWSKNSLACRFKWLRKKLGIRKDERGENVVPYTIRHTVATKAAANGVRDRMLAEIMGHTSTRTTYRYQHLQVEHLQEAMKLIHKRKKAPGNSNPGALPH